MIRELVLGGLLLLALYFGAFAQGVAYYLTKNLWAFSPVYYLNVLTVVSIGLFVAAFIFVAKGFKPKSRTLLNCIILLLGIPTTLWSFFVWAMWQG